MTALLSFKMNGLPRGQGRPHATARGGFVTVYKAAKDRTYEKTVADVAKAAMAGRSPYEGPLVLSLRFRLPIPKSATKKARELMASGQVAPTVKPDLSNALKAIEDAMNGIVYVDDVQIARGIQEKIYAEVPGVDVVLRRWFPPTQGGEA